MEESGKHINWQDRSEPRLAIVTLDGKVQPGVYECTTGVNGSLTRPVRDDDGVFVCDEGTKSIVTETLYGNVEVEFKEN